MAAEFVTDYIDKWADLRGDAIAYRFLTNGETEETTLTFDALRIRSRALTQELLRSCAPGDRVVLLLPTSLDFIIGFFATIQAGLIAVPLPAPSTKRINLAAPTLAKIFENCKPRIVITSRALQEQRSAFNRHSWAFAVPEWKVIDTGASSVLDLGLGPLPDLTPGTLALLQYTSGSTSDPKGVMLSHGNIAANQAMLSQVESLVDGQTGVATWLPHHHDMGLGIHIFALTRGITCTFMSPAHFVQRPLRWLEAISRYRVTGTCSPHFALDVCNRRANDIGHSKLDLSSLRCMIIGAEPLVPKVIADFADNFERYGLEPACITPCYGLAESTVLSTATPRRRPKVLRVDQASYRKSLIVPSNDQRGSIDLVSCGSAGRDHGVAICDPDTGRILPEGSVGEVWLNGPSLGSGYWCMPEASRITFNARTADGRDGYLRTGDLGCLWEGELYITGRTKDLIIIRGRNLYPQDIENVIRAGPNALNNGAAVAFAEMHDDGERIAVVVERDRHSPLTPDELAQGVRRLVQEAFDVEVGRVLVVQSNAIPKTSSGKLRRQHCRGMVFNHDIGILAEAGMLN